MVRRSHLSTAKVVLCIGLCLLLWSPAEAGLIVNGDFEQGNVGFTTQYVYTPGAIGAAESYDILPNPRPAHSADTASYGDHTTGSGLMMAVNGAEIPNQIVWSETMTVVPNSDYTFSLWISSWFAGSPATLNITFDGVSIGTPTAPSTAGVWQQFSTSWNSGANTSLTINLVDTNLADIGSDFALDDISLDGPNPSAAPEPSGIILALCGAGLLGSYRLRRQRR